MKLANYIGIILLAFLLVFMDISFFSIFAWNDTAIISSYVIAILLAIELNSKRLIAYQISVALFISIFSSIPIYNIVLLYWAIPAFIFFLRAKYLPEPSYLAAVVYLLATSLLFQVILSFSLHTSLSYFFISLISFALINTLVGIMIFVIAKLLSQKNKLFGF